jgi:tetratricopeptide (TPR) repeat protein/2-polyprenyl-3-methyl-5-hydroxy-6-metoxy-1,4-benzoquinol methylase
MNRAEKRRQQRIANKAARKGQPLPLTAPFPHRKPLTIQQAIDVAVQHQSVGELTNAKSIYENILQTEPDHPVALHLLGVVALQSGKNDIAVDLIRKALAIKPDYADAHSNLGGALLQMREMDDAVSSYRESLALRPDHAEANYDLGFALQERGDLDDAIASYRRALDIRPDYVEAFYNLGLALQKKGMPDDAIASYREALTLQPGFAEAHNNLGNVLKEQGKLDDAVASYREALTIRPELAEAHANFGNVLEAQGKLDDAVASYRKAITFKPDYAEAHYDLGVALQKLGKLDDAVAGYRKSLAIQPDYYEACRNLGNVLVEQGKLDDAVAVYREALIIKPGSAEVYGNLGIALKSGFFEPTAENIRILLGLMDSPVVSGPDVALSLTSTLKQVPEIAQLLARLENGEDLGSTAVLPDVLETLTSIPLLLRLFELTPIPDSTLEQLLTNIRAGLLGFAGTTELPERAIVAAAALATQCFINEYVFFQTKEEELRVERLAATVEQALAVSDPVSPLDLAVLASYRPLWKLEGYERVLTRQWPDALAVLLRIQIAEPFEERSLRSTIPALTQIADDTSLAVQNQYEDSPYPRWMKGGFSSTSISLEKLKADMGARPATIPDPAEPEILIAGCGTGQQSIGAATRYTGSQVLAIDLSLSSLTYAKRKTAELGLTNIDYQHGDILELRHLDRRFDVIECGGVLHHMADPIAGWQVLVDLLKPDGLMMIGLYSELARRDVVKGREHISRTGFDSGDGDIRRFRADILALSADDPLVKLAEKQDFFSLSECRDLLFHVQEHRFTLPEIDTALERLGLEFLRFEDAGILENYRTRFPGKSRRSMANWHIYETENPDTFWGMYQFWVQKSV